MDTAGNLYSSSQADFSMDAQTKRVLEKFWSGMIRQCLQKSEKQSLQPIWMEGFSNRDTGVVYGFSHWINGALEKTWPRGAFLRPVWQIKTPSIKKGLGGISLDDQWKNATELATLVSGARLYLSGFWEREQNDKVSLSANITRVGGEVLATGNLILSKKEVPDQLLAPLAIKGYQASFEFPTGEDAGPHVPRAVFTQKGRARAVFSREENVTLFLAMDRFTLWRIFYHDSKGRAYQVGRGFADQSVFQSNKGKVLVVPGGILPCRLKLPAQEGAGFFSFYASQSYLSEAFVRKVSDPCLWPVTMPPGEMHAFYEKYAQRRRVEMVRESLPVWVVNK